MIKCKHCLGDIEKNEINEEVCFCELTDNYRNITLGDCLGNCESQEEEMIKGRLKIIEDNRVAFYCMGCKCYHYISINGINHPVWNFNGDYNKPTFSPSVLVKSGHYTGKENIKDCWCTYAKEHPEEKIPYKCGICHSFVTDGKIQYLSDCTHEFAGRTVEMEFPK